MTIKLLITLCYFSLSISAKYIFSDLSEISLKSINKIFQLMSPFFEMQFKEHMVSNNNS